jgi:hypothetical protein
MIESYNDEKPRGASYLRRIHLVPSNVAFARIG